MTGDPLRRNATLVEMLGGALRDGGHALGTVPALLRQVLEADGWREFVTQRGEHVQHERFEDFVTTQPLKGLGATVGLVRRVVADDTVTLDLLDAALKRNRGGDRSKDTNSELAPAPRGTTKEASLRKLRADAPDLHAQVLAGNLSAHAAMVKAGFRPARFTVEIRSTESIAATLRKYLDKEQRATLAALLLDG